MLYGYAVKELNEEGLLELREVRFAASPEVLREIARFLAQMAELMENGGFARCSHRHIGSVIHGWDKRFAGKDVIVMPPIGGKFLHETKIVR